jgi:hypothetical protein
MTDENEQIVPGAMRDPTPEEIAEQIRIETESTGSGAQPNMTDVARIDDGIRMLEVDSYERLIAGLITASEGGRMLSHKLGDGRWDSLSDVLDKIRVSCCRLAGLMRPGDETPTKVRRGSDIFGPMLESYAKIYDGLTAAEAAARQLATCHRGDLRWSQYANSFDLLRTKSSVSIRQRRLRESGVALPMSRTSH